MGAALPTAAAPLCAQPQIYFRLSFFSLLLLTKPSPMGSDCEIWGCNDQSDDGFFLDEN